MIPKSENRFSEKIMLKHKASETMVRSQSEHGLVTSMTER